uniref:Uncharacterized protein n=1 Tax=Lepeophtheirus salmonis TaxID=72036 RepID=A0A0K2VAI0_LEPSM
MTTSHNSLVLRSICVQTKREPRTSYRLAKSKSKRNRSEEDRLGTIQKYKAMFPTTTTISSVSKKEVRPLAKL